MYLAAGEACKLFCPTPEFAAKETLIPASAVPHSSKSGRRIAAWGWRCVFVCVLGGGGGIQCEGKYQYSRIPGSRQNTQGLPIKVVSALYRTELRLHGTKSPLLSVTHPVSVLSNRR